MHLGDDAKKVVESQCFNGRRFGKSDETEQVHPVLIRKRVATKVPGVRRCATEAGTVGGRETVWGREWKGWREQKEGGATDLRIGTSDW